MHLLPEPITSDAVQLFTDRRRENRGTADIPPPSYIWERTESGKQVPRNTDFWAHAPALPSEVRGRVLG